MKTAIWAARDWLRSSSKSSSRFSCRFESTFMTCLSNEFEAQIATDSYGMHRYATVLLSHPACFVIMLVMLVMLESRHIATHDPSIKLGDAKFPGPLRAVWSDFWLCRQQLWSAAAFQNLCHLSRKMRKDEKTWEKMNLVTCCDMLWLGLCLVRVRFFHVLPSKVQVMIDRDSGRSRGFGFVTFEACGKRNQKHRDHRTFGMLGTFWRCLKFRTLMN